jgi:chromosome segregation ATPase
VAIQSTSDDINRNLQKLKSDIERDIQNHESRLNNLNGEVQSLNQKFTEISSDKDNVYAEINKMNLILSGLPDCISESNDQLSIALNR